MIQPDESDSARDPLLILMPGMDGTGRLFRPFLDVLPPEVRVQALSYPPAIADYAELLPDVLAAIPKDEKCVLVGESFSGPLAVMAATACPERVAGIVLVASFLRSPRLWIPRWVRRFVVPEWFSAAPRTWRARILLGKFETPSLRSLVDDALDATPPETMVRRLIQIHRVNVRAEFAKLTMPALYLRGTKDRLVPAWNGEEAAVLRTNVKLQALPAPHLVLQTMPHEAASCISRFMERIASERQPSAPETID